MEALKKNDLMDIAPDSDYSKAVEVIENWKNKYKKVYKEFENILTGFAGLRVTPLSAGLMLLVSLTHTAIPYALYFGAMVRLPTQTVALMSYLDPITALLLSALVLHEPLSPAGLAGAALVLGATLLSELWARKKPT